LATRLAAAERGLAGVGRRACRLRVSVTIGSAPAGEVPEKDQHDRQELQAPRAHHISLLLRPSAFDVAVDVARLMLIRPANSMPSVGQSRDDHQKEQDVWRGSSHSSSAPFYHSFMAGPRQPRAPPAQGSRIPRVAATPVAARKDRLRRLFRPDHSAACTVPYSTGLGRLAGRSRRADRAVRGVHRPVLPGGAGPTPG